MSRVRRTADEVLHEIEALARAVREGKDAAQMFGVLDRALAVTIGHRLFTIMRYHAGSAESERLYSTNPAAYPVGGRKVLPASQWADRVLRRREPFLGRDAADIRAVFPDHALIASLGLQSVLNVPVLRGGAVLGTLNLLHQEGWYDEPDFGPGAVFAALAIPALDLVGS